MKNEPTETHTMVITNKDIQTLSFNIVKPKRVIQPTNQTWVVLGYFKQQNIGFEQNVWRKLMSDVSLSKHEETSTEHLAPKPTQDPANSKKYPIDYQKTQLKRIEFPTS